MRSVLPSCALLLALAPPAEAQARVDTYWQRDAGVKYYDNILPFRHPTGVVGDIIGQCRDLLADLQEMRRLATECKPEEKKLDEKGREICTLSTWQREFDNAKSNGLSMAGWLSKVFRESDSAMQRRTCMYGMFYFNNPQEVFDLIAVLPGEPLRDIREEGFTRALHYLRVHLPLSKAQNPRNPDNGVVVPKYDFNPLPFFLLLQQPKAVDQAQALWFLTEVLKIRPDLGRAYLQETLPEIRRLLVSPDRLVRTHAVQFLAAIEREQDRVPVDAEKVTDEEREAWLKTLEDDLFPPIRHVSTGRTDLYPGPTLDQIVKVGAALLTDSFLPKASAHTPKSATKYRYGVRLARLPEPLDELGLPPNAVIVEINGQPTRNADDVRRLIDEQLEGIAARVKQRAAREAAAAEIKKRELANRPPQPEMPGVPKGDDPQKKENIQKAREGRRREFQPVATFMVEYVHDQRNLLKEFRLLN